jgi:hypothetical protein
VTRTAPTTFSNGVLLSSADLNPLSSGISELQASWAAISYVQGGSNADTVTASSGTWLTLGNITVPTWATSAFLHLDLSLISVPTAGTFNVSITPKIGSAAGSARRLLPGTAVTLFNQSLSDVITGLSAGSQAVTLLATFGGGSALSFRSAANSSYVTGWALFQ